MMSKVLNKRSPYQNDTQFEFAVEHTEINLETALLCMFSVTSHGNFGGNIQIFKISESLLSAKFF